VLGALHAASRMTAGIPAILMDIPGTATTPIDRYPS